MSGCSLNGQLRLFTSGVDGLGIEGVGKGEGMKVGERRDKKGGKGRNGRKRKREVFT